MSQVKAIAGRIARSGLVRSIVPSALYTKFINDFSTWPV